MNALSVTYNGEEIDPEQYLPDNIYDITSLLIRELDGRLGYPITEREIMGLHSNLNKTITLFDPNLGVNGSIDTDYDKNLDSVTIPIWNGKTNKTINITLKWSRLNLPLKVMISD